MGVGGLMPAVKGKDLAVVGAKLKAAGAGGLRRQLLAGIRLGASPLIGDVREAAREKLPKSGGLNTYVADSNLSIATRLTGPKVGVRIVDKQPNASRAGTRNFGSDKGFVRHPVFGHRDRKWAVTKVEPGWFSKTLEEKAPTVTPFVAAALAAVAAEVTKL